jgi:hypothetical protein
MNAAEIKKIMPPSTGMQGGGQQPGPVEGGGGGAACNAVMAVKNTTLSINFILFISRYKYTKIM